MNILKICFLLSLTVFFSMRAKAAARPNILFIFADDWGQYASVYDTSATSGSPFFVLNKSVKTPNIDKLASQGVLFRNAHVAAPSCTPSRSALLTGQYFWRTGRGAILRGAQWDPALPSYPLLLRDAGYDIGKTHKVWSPGTPVDAPFGGQRYAFETAGKQFGNFSQNVTKLIKAGKSTEDAKNVIYGEVRGNFRAFLDSRKEGNPFHYWFGPTNTHRVWQKGSGKNLWNIDPDSLKGKVPPFLPDVPEIREDIADYLGEVAALDAAIGVIIDELKKTGEYDNTLIVLSGDHGIPGFPNGKCNLYNFGTGVPLVIAGPGVKGGRVVDDFTHLTDLAPTFLEAASVPVPPATTGRSIWNILRSEKSGQVEPERTWLVTGRERHVEAARAGFLPYPQRAIRNGQFLFILNFKPDRYPMGDFDALDKKPAPTLKELENNTRIALADLDASPTKAWIIANRNTDFGKKYFDIAAAKRPRAELYDLKNDPYEMTNVAADPRYAKIRAELEAQLLAELKRTGDPRLENDGAYYENPPLSGPTE